MTSSFEFEQLPTELFRFILIYLSPEDIAALAQTCTRMNMIIRDENLWRKYFLQRYTYFTRIPQYSVNEYLLNSTQKCVELSNDSTWQEEFRRRAFEDQQIRFLFHEMISDRMNRVAHAAILSSTHGLFTIDTLKKNVLLSNSISLSSRNLTREYYSSEISRLISRNIGLNLLIEIKNQNSNISTEGKALFNALMIIQSFHPHGIFLSIDRLNQIARQIRMNTIFSTNNLQEKCQLIMSTMESERFLPANGSEGYYNLENSFLYSTFHGTPTIPLTLVSIFCALADQCHLKARPVGFPGEVMAVVEPTTSDHSIQPLIISVFHREILSLNEINERFSDAYEEPLVYPLPITPIVDLIIRSARNMIHSISRYPTSSLNSYGLYASVSILKILEGGAIRFTHDSVMNVLKEHFPLDINFFQTLSSSTTINDLRLNPIEEKRRSDNSSPEFCVGQIFQHRQYHYWGVICGWDSICQASTSWQVQMAVENLQRGALQPFYHILRNDCPRRYVAEDNIDIFAYHSLVNEEGKQSILQKLCEIDDIGKYFIRVDIDRGKFIPNEELHNEYPDDFF